MEIFILQIVIEYSILSLSDEDLIELSNFSNDFFIFSTLIPFIEAELSMTRLISSLLLFNVTPPS